jgi:methionine biosynthesis protein MetW
MSRLTSGLAEHSDLAAMIEWIEPGSRVLDLGCGDGSLLEQLIRLKGVRGMGVDIDQAHLLHCLEKGLPVVQRDLNGGLAAFGDQSYDTVIVSQTIHQVRYPDKLVDEVLRVGRRAVVSFPNFGHWALRLELLLKGRTPKNELLPYEWWQTPNIHFFTLEDFKGFCAARQVRILKCHHLWDGQVRERLPFANLLSQGSVVLLGR